MHKDDQMTPNERLAAFFSGGDMDRLPTMPFFVSVAGKIAGMTHREKRSSAENQAKAQIVTYEKMGHDGLTVEYGLHGIGHACGSKWNDPEDGVPAIVEHVMQTIEDVDKLNPDDYHKENDPWMKLNLDACVICNEEVGDEVGVNISTPGPMTAASSLLPVDKLLRAMRRDPERVHQLLRFVTDGIKYVTDEFRAVNGGCFLCDPIASCNIMSAKEFKEFVQPYTKEIIDHVHAAGAGVGYHICGNTTKITEAMIETGCDMLSIDTAVSLAYAKEVAGDKVPLIGNVDPNQTMMLGTRDDIYQNMKENLKDAWDSPKGYIISTGCDIPINSPMENNYIFMEAVRELGKCPLDPKRWN
jgi:uroporphyrinogen decarboxylase